MKEAISYIFTKEAPIPIGPYSQAVRVENLLFTSGQIAIDPKTGELIKGDIKDETRQVLENIKAVLKAAGMSLGDVIKVNIYLVEIKDFPKVNEVYEEYFKTDHPARATVAVAALPKGARIEMDAIAYQPSSSI